jgi:hypothetical protein
VCVRDLPAHIDPCGVFRVRMIRSNFAQNLDQKLGTWEKNWSFFDGLKETKELG